MPSAAASFHDAVQFVSDFTFAGAELLDFDAAVLASAHAVGGTDLVVTDTRGFVE